MSQAALAERAQLSVSLVSKLEAGHKGAKLESLLKLAKALDVTAAELLPHPFGTPSAGPITDRASERSRTTPRSGATQQPRFERSLVRSISGPSWNTASQARDKTGGEHARLLERTRSLSRENLQLLSYIAELMASRRSGS
jgi:transcriptional regulator with XRE-family HTH domain